jgi:urea-proton symporter
MALAVTLRIRAETKWLGTRKTFEWFSTAGRTIKTGLIASSVVSAGTWAATLLESSTVAYQFGISGPFWYAVGTSIQVVLFAILALEVKRKAPSSYTFPEIIHVRFGKNSHRVLLCFAYQYYRNCNAGFRWSGSCEFSYRDQYLHCSISYSSQRHNLYIF